MTSVKIISLAAEEIAKNVLMGIEPVRKARLRGIRTASTPPSLETLFLYAFRLPSICRKYAGEITGKDILEIGPGDHLANGLTFLALGAKSYTVLDRFKGNYSSPTSKLWYKLTRDNFEATFGVCWPDDLDSNSFPESCPKVKIFDQAVEHAPDFAADIVCSHNVGEHVTDTAAFAEVHKKLLKPQGTAIHVVDFGGHNWELDPRDPFLFRRLPGWLWKAMGSNRGYPNRIPFEEYQSILGRALTVSAKDLKPFKFDKAVQEATFVCSLKTQ